MRRAIRCAVLALCIPAIGVAAQKPPEPVPHVAYQTWTVLSVDGEARTAYFRNDTPYPITITAVIIEQCENTRQRCGENPANKVVASGKTEKILVIDRFDPKLGWRFAFTLRTHIDRPEEPPPPPPQRIVSMGMRPSNGGPDVPVQQVPVDLLIVAVPAVSESDGKCIAGKSPEPAGRQVSMVFGTASHPATRAVKLSIDATGKPFRLEDVRADTSGVGSERTGPFASITIMIPDQVALIRNVVNGTTQFLSVSGPNIMTAAQLGNPAALIERLQSSCGGQ